MISEALPSPYGLQSLYVYGFPMYHVYIYIYVCIWGFPNVSVVENLPAMQKNWVRSLGQEDPLEKGMDTHSSILPWRIPLTEEPEMLTVHGVAKSQK